VSYHGQITCERRENSNRRQEGFFHLGDVTAGGHRFWLGVFAYMLDPAGWLVLFIPANLAEKGPEWLFACSPALCCGGLSVVW